VIPARPTHAHRIDMETDIAMAQTLNSLVTALLRQRLQKEYWAFLSPQDLALGDYGYIDSNGDFERVGNYVFAAQIGAPQTGGDYSMQDEGTSAEQGEADLHGVFIDPDGGEVTIGTSFTWSSTKSEAAQTTWKNVTTTCYADLLQPLTDAAAVQNLWAEAKEYGYIARDGAIKTGFCVVVEIVQVYAGAAVASVSSSSNFTIAGSVEGMADFINGNAGGCYTSVTDQSGVAQYTWPAQAAQKGAKTDNPLHTVAVQLATFDAHNNPIMYQ
jgi:hypothetical protein